ncbi:MAG: MBL fold metallo-hydrolase [Clostridium sp.]|nr:MBL fold metallo-hydrolase [Clostridium sp.]MCM1444339.1 MBL fold metallo-hydrolase [Candidatus Amulumruptor caecigallinarius]
MNIEKIVVGALQTNCYIISYGDNCMVIDPGDEYDKIKNVIGNRQVIGIIITHYHFDHIGALSYFNTEIIDYKYKNGTYNIGQFNFEVIHTPGHKEDSITIYFKNENVMFTGDFIFKGSIGRVDLEGGNLIEMKKSLNKILQYNDDIIIYPGHGNGTMLGEEKKNFMYFSRGDLF